MFDSFKDCPFFNDDWGFDSWDIGCGTKPVIVECIKDKKVKKVGDKPCNKFCQPCYKPVCNDPCKKACDCKLCNKSYTSIYKGGY